MNHGSAFLAGVIGGAVMTVIMAVERAFGMRIHFEMMLGTMLDGDPSIAKWALGLIVHLALSGVIGLLYAFGFEHVTKRAGWLVGVAFSVVHTVIAGILIGLVPAVSPLVPEIMPAPGPFMSNKGAVYVVAFALLHFVYGAVVGEMYGPVRTLAGRIEERSRRSP